MKLLKYSYVVTMFNILFNIYSNVQQILENKIFNMKGTWHLGKPLESILAASGQPWDGSWSSCAVLGKAIGSWTVWVTLSVLRAWHLWESQKYEAGLASKHRHGPIVWFWVLTSSLKNFRYLHRKTGKPKVLGGQAHYWLRHNRKPWCP